MAFPLGSAPTEEEKLGSGEGSAKLVGRAPGVACLAEPVITNLCLQRGPSKRVGCSVYRFGQPQLGEASTA